MSTHVCPTCRQSFDPQHSESLPFCSPRCRQIDLGRWLDERYPVPVQPRDEDDEAAPDEPAD